MIFLQHVEKHRHAAGRISPRQDDRVTLSLTERVGDFSEEVKLQLRITPKQSR